MMASEERIAAAIDAIGDADGSRDSVCRVLRAFATDCEREVAKRIHEANAATFEAINRALKNAGDYLYDCAAVHPRSTEEADRRAAETMGHEARDA